MVGIRINHEEGVEPALINPFSLILAFGGGDFSKKDKIQPTYQV